MKPVRIRIPHNDHSIDFKRGDDAEGSGVPSDVQTTDTCYSYDASSDTQYNCDFKDSDVESYDGTDIGEAISVEVCAGFHGLLTRMVLSSDFFLKHFQRTIGGYSPSKTYMFKLKSWIWIV
ncbi:unnamed protein product [Ambrosiozyma monospora]|uniref:Unnamed protein product n=1 Tax=Ambrosiozyma monospora TaxID=43982 RepID=A0ACB5TRP8_AMBMO|nr:unnamed protein product [Ambrosiozyma monospora]